MGLAAVRRNVSLAKAFTDVATQVLGLNYTPLSDSEELRLAQEKASRERYDKSFDDLVDEMGYKAAVAALNESTQVSEAQAGVDEATWERSGLILLSVDENKTLVLFSSDAEMSDFKRRLSEYQGGPPPDQRGAPHQQIFAAIDEVRHTFLLR